MCILSSETEDAYNNLKEKIETVSNACRYSLFVFLDIESALMVCRKNIMGCLYLAEGQFDNLINKINLLEEFKLICFEDEVSNQKFQEYWLERKKEEIGEKARNKQTIEIVGKRITIVNIVNKLAAMNFSKETANHKMVTIT